MSTCNTNDSKMFSFLMEKFNCFSDYNGDDTAAVSIERRQMVQFSIKPRYLKQCAKIKVPMSFATLLSKMAYTPLHRSAKALNSQHKRKKQTKCRKETSAYTQCAMHMHRLHDKNQKKNTFQNILLASFVDFNYYCYYDMRSVCVELAHIIAKIEMDSPVNAITKVHIYTFIH